MSSAQTSSAPAVEDPRVPLQLRNGTAVFLVSLAGLMMANLAPLIMSVLEEVGFDVVASGNILTWTLFASAVVGLGTSRLAAGSRRRTLAASGLIVAVLGFSSAALASTPSFVVAAFVIGGAGVGTAISTSGAAIAALRNPNRVSATSGVVNRLLVMVVLAVIPLIGLAQVTVFGALALLSFLSLVVTIWLPDTPELAASDAEAAPTADTAKPATPRRVMFAGIAVLLVFPLWGTSEDAVWTLAPVLGDAVDVSEQTLGFALSAAAGVGAAAMVIVTVFGRRIGRAIPLAIALVLGGAVKIWIGITDDPVTLAVLIVVVNTIYAFAFVLFIATAAGLDARGTWSGPLIGAYIVGSSFAPIIGAWLIDVVGIQTFGVIVGIVSFVLVIPTMLIARESTRVEKALSHLDRARTPQ